MKRQKYYSETFILDSSVMSHMEISKENFMNFHDAETQVDVGESLKISRDKRGDWCG